MVNNVHEIFNAAREVYDILTGDVTVYVDDYGIYWTNIQDAGENARPVTPEEFIKSANDIQIDTDNRGYVTEAILVIDSPSYDAQVKIEPLTNYITASNNDEEVTLSYEVIDNGFPLYDTILELHENVLL